ALLARLFVIAVIAALVAFVIILPFADRILSDPIIGPLLTAEPALLASSLDERPASRVACDLFVVRQVDLAARHVSGPALHANLQPAPIFRKHGHVLAGLHLEQDLRLLARACEQLRGLIGPDLLGLLGAHDAHPAEHYDDDQGFHPHARSFYK